MTRSEDVVQGGGDTGREIELRGTGKTLSAAKGFHASAATASSLAAAFRSPVALSSSQDV